MPEIQTQPTNQNVADFLNTLPDEQRRLDCLAVVDLMQEVTGAKPRMWGPAIVGFGTYDYTYASGQSGTSPLLGFSPRKQNLTLYLTPGFDQRYAELMSRLGKFKTGKVCLYLNCLADVDSAILHELLTRSVADLQSN